MQINATLINLYNVCKRECWLHANGIRFEHTSELVFEGKIIHESTYLQRSVRYKELQIDGIKIDFYDEKNKVIHEIKKSDKAEEAHEWQLKYYIYVLESKGINGVSGILEYPLLRRTQKIVLSEADRNQIDLWKNEIAEVITSDQCPPIAKTGICKNCSYYEFCFTNENES